MFNAGSFESARRGFADYARSGESATELRARVNEAILEDLEEKVLALRALHAKLRYRAAGESFGEVVGRGRPRSEMLKTGAKPVRREGSVFEFRLRILGERERDTDSLSFLGIVEGFP